MILVKSGAINSRPRLSDEPTAIFVAKVTRQEWQEC